MVNQKSDVWILAANAAIVSYIDLIEATYKVDGMDVMTGIVEYALCGDSRYLDDIFDRCLQSDDPQGYLGDLIDEVLTFCKVQFDAIVHHYGSVPTTFAVQGAAVHPVAHSVRVIIRDWR